MRAAREDFIAVDKRAYYERPQSAGVPVDVFSPTHSAVAEVLGQFRLRNGWDVESPARASTCS